MHDSSRARQLDTFVVDDPDDAWRPPRSLEEVDVQIRLDDGAYHRIATLTFTACGEPINLRLQQEQRRQKYEGHICAKCYSPFELALTKTTNDSLAADFAATNADQVIGDQDRKIAEWLTAPTVSKPPKRKR